MTSATIFQIQSALILALLLIGVYFRRNRARHIKIMSFVIAWDILLVLQIELTRSAIDKASRVVTNSGLLNIHVSIAVSTVILYLVLIYLGRKLLKGQEKYRPWHRRLGMLTVGMRILTFVTSFFAVTNG
ncbi:MAG: hypothetical protein JNM93_12290 [Bacteriovoracaceae bacterium]|nr:hypothetical protein [Bacteriovoracaceae bacterium]